MTAHSRPRTMRSTTTRLATERGSLFITVCVDDDGQPVLVLGSLGKIGSLEQCAVETACRLVSMYLRRGTPLQEILGRCRGIGEMQPRPNRMPGGRTVQVRGIGDGIAHVLREYVRPMAGRSRGFTRSPHEPPCYRKEGRRRHER